MIAQQLSLRETMKKWIRIRKEDDDDYEERSIMLDPHEIDVLISTLNLFKFRILNPKSREEYEC
jgi:hypothetical protein